MVSRKVVQSGFRPVSDPFGGSRGFALFLEKTLHLMVRQRNQNIQNQRIIPATKKQNEVMML